MRELPRYGILCLLLCLSLLETSAKLACGKATSEEGKRTSTKSQPGDWESTGAKLYSGREKFAEGGEACCKCHAIGHRRFFSSLEKIAAKEQSSSELYEFLQKPDNMLMRRAYRKHPISAEEASALAEYFSSVGGAKKPE